MREFFFGQDPASVAITDPNLLRARRTREQLRGRYQEQLEGAPTAGEEAIMQAAGTGAERLGETAKGRAAGTRGFARLAALSDVNRAAGVGAQRILGEAATAAGAQRARDVERAEEGMLALDAAGIEQMRLEEEIRRARAKPGALGILGTLAGAGIGAATGGYGGAVKGAQLGGALGTGVQQFGRRL